MLMRFHERLLGLGYAMVITNTIIGIYYNVIVSWTIYYFFASMTSRLPWEDCNNSWNTIYCVATAEMKNITGSNNFPITLFVNSCKCERVSTLLWMGGMNFEVSGYRPCFSIVYDLDRPSSVYQPAFSLTWYIESMTQADAVREFQTASPRCKRTNSFIRIISWFWGYQIQISIRPPSWMLDFLVNLWNKNDSLYKLLWLTRDQRFINNELQFETFNIAKI